MATVKLQTDWEINWQEDTYVLTWAGNAFPPITLSSELEIFSLGYKDLMNINGTTLVWHKNSNLQPLSFEDLKTKILNLRPSRNNYYQLVAKFTANDFTSNTSIGAQNYSGHPTNTFPFNTVATFDFYCHEPGTYKMSYFHVTNPSLGILDLYVTPPGGTKTLVHQQDFYSANNLLFHAREFTFQIQDIGTVTITMENPTRNDNSGGFNLAFIQIPMKIYKLPV